jgi:MraZ protein
MFLGQYRHTIDTKGRLIVPARFRDLLADGAYVAQGFDNNLMVLTEPAFELISRRVSQMSMTDQSARLLKRLIFSAADRVEMDKAGRIRIPQFLLQVAQLDAEAVVVGVGDYIEIWSPQTWEDQEEDLLDNHANAQRFAALDLPPGLS